jgi:hypothetical protein
MIYKRDKFLLRALIVIALIVPINALTGCATWNWRAYGGAGIGQNQTKGPSEWAGDDSAGCMAELGIQAARPVYEIDLFVFHVSQCTRGDAFDDRVEDRLNGYYLKGRYYVDL